MSAGDITIPKVGTVPRKVAIPVGVGVAAFVGWRIWQARSASPAAEDGSTVEDGEFGAVDSAIPGVLNPWPSSFTSGSSGGSSSATGDRNGDGLIGPGEFTTNGEWTEYVTGKLQQSDTWSYTDIVTALGNGLAGKPTTDTQQQILRAAIAVGGQPPVGSITYVAGGNTDLTVAPGGPVVSTGTTTASVAFTSIPGAASYQVFRNGVSSPVGSGSTSPIEVGGLTPNTSYTFQVAGVTSSGKVGPKTGAVGGKTKAANVAKPSTPSISAVTSNSARAQVGAVANADEYLWFLNGAQRAVTEGTGYTFSGLKPKTKYTVTVAARGFHQLASAASAGASFTTK